MTLNAMHVKGTPIPHPDPTAQSEKECVLLCVDLYILISLLTTLALTTPELCQVGVAYSQTQGNRNIKVNDTVYS